MSSDNSEFEALLRRFRTDVNSQPTRQDLADQEAEREVARRQAEQRFFDFVTNGSRALAQVLGEAGVEPDPYIKASGHQSVIAARGFVLRETVKYGSNTDWPAYLGVHPGTHLHNTNDHGRKLVINANDGSLFITGSRGRQDWFIGGVYAPSQWLREDAIKTPEDASRLQREAENDMQAVIRNYPLP